MRWNLRYMILGGLFGTVCFAFLFALFPVVPEQASADAPTKPPEDFKKYSESIPGTEISFEMIPIPGGSFVMGSPENEVGHDKHEGPQHSVTLRPFWMGKCEVTWDEFDIFWKKSEAAKTEKSPREKEADAISRPTNAYVDETYGHNRDGNPVICMTHHAAMEYCRWLSVKTGKTYRLPTEAEWEYAARAGTKSAYFFGDDPKQLDDYAWYKKNSDELVHEVGKKKPNPWGLHDIYGNVYEWCLDHYKSDYYSSFSMDKPTLGPLLMPTEKRFSHVVRGGSWADDASKCRSSWRLGSDKKWIKWDPQSPQSIWWLTKWDVLGFRVVRPVDEYDNLKGFRSKVTKESQ